MNAVIERATTGLLRRVCFWIRPDVLPEHPVKLLHSGRVCYVLETGGMANLLALQTACQQHGLPLPLSGHGHESWDVFEPPLCDATAEKSSSEDKATDESTVDGDTIDQRPTHNGYAAIVSIRQGRGLLFSRSHPQLTKLRSLVEQGMGEDTLFVPVAMYWGRSPEKEASVLKLLFSENWQIAGRTRKFFTTLLHGRNTLVRFSEPIKLAELAEEEKESERVSRKLARILRVHFRARRNATLGPDQSHKNTVIGKVLQNPAVLRAIEQEEAKGEKNRKTPREKANQYAHEIAADMSYTTIRILQLLLQALWNRIYDGVRFEGLDRLREVTDGNEIVYVPCHRSHIDYLLLSYALYVKGFSLPHIAAGINLNLPVLGSILRRGGAFFLRRSFGGNRLYSTVFNSYVQEIIVNGYSMEYFIEGGRSRSGRLLPPKGGMLSMTIQAYLRDSRRPVIFVPVYFGYERMVEGQSFISELAGGKKEKESLLGLFSSLKTLRQRFGEVYANIGTPIALNDFLDQQAPGWNDAPESDEKPEWLAPAIDTLGTEIMQQINSAAALTPVSLLALALLAAPRENLSRADLISQLELLLRMLKDVPYSEALYLPEYSAEDIVAHGEALDYVHTEAHELGEIVLVNRSKAVALTYFRNNILHLFAVPATIAACFMNRDTVDREEIERLVRLAYPFLQAELFIAWKREDLSNVTGQYLEFFCEQGLLNTENDRYRRTDEPPSAIVQLTLLAGTTTPALQRYYLAATLMGRQESGTLSQNDLERLCELCAERLSIMHGLHSPDFFDRKLFRSFIDSLKELEILSVDDDGLLHFEGMISAVESQARLLLDDGIRHSIQGIAANSV